MTVLAVLAATLVIVVSAPSNAAAPAGGVSRVCMLDGAVQSPQPCGDPVLSTDGRFVAVESYDSDFGPGGHSFWGKILIEDLDTGELSLGISGVNGTEPNGPSDHCSLSDGARFLACISSAGNLVSATGTVAQHLFVTDRTTGVTQMVDVSPTGAPANGLGDSPKISGDGRWVVFASSASNLVPGDSNRVGDIFERDLWTGRTSLVSLLSDGSQVNGGSAFPSVSHDGRFVVFSSGAPNLVNGVPRFADAVFVHDRDTGTTTRVDVAPDGTPANLPTQRPAALSDDGRFVAFSSAATNLVPGDTNNGNDVYVKDTVTGGVERVLAGAQEGRIAGEPSISPNGRYVAFQDRVAPIDANHIARYDRVTGQFAVSTDWQGQPADGDAPVVSDDGLIAFHGDQLTTEDSNGVGESFVDSIDPPSVSHPRCVDFTFQEDAQAMFDRDRVSYSWLDLHGDGYPCASLPRRHPLDPPAPGTGPQSDDFTTTTRQPFWTFYGSEDVPLVLTGTSARFVLQDAEHDIWDGVNNAPRLLQEVRNVNFEVEAKFETAPAGPGQFEGIYLEAAPGYWLRFVTYNDAGTNYVTASTGADGIATARPSQPVAAGSAVWIRVKRTDTTYTGSYSLDGRTWTVFDTVPFTRLIARVGPYAGNAAVAGVSSAFVVDIDHFFNTARPIDPQDGGAPAGPANGGDPADPSGGGGPTEPGDGGGATPPATTDPHPVELAPAGAHAGYWMLDQGGEVYAFGDAPGLGHPSASAVDQVDLEPTPSGRGYRILSTSGAVAAFGDASWLGGATGQRLLPGEAFASLSGTPDGGGYWIFTTFGRVFTYGDAPYLGDMGGTRLNGPVLGSVSTPSGRGYYLVGSDGGIFAFGDAAYAGSMGGRPLNAPVRSLVPTASGAGYWLVAADGGIFAFGDAGFFGSMGGQRLNAPVTGMVAAGPGGYLMVATDGGIFAFGTARFLGSLGARPPARPIVSVALLPG
jgi:hypothetical protein